MPLTLGELITAAVSGGLGAKLLEWSYEELKRRAGEARSAKQVVDQHLDPILKSADELVGKIRSLARRDFRPLYRTSKSEMDPDLELLSCMYLFAQLWAWVQLLRQESKYVVLSSVDKGKKLQEFVRALESTSIRVVSRAVQRGVGEALIVTGERQGVLSLYEFAERYEKDAQLKAWSLPLRQVLSGPEHTDKRQRVLVYGAVVHSMLDTLDPEHRVSRDRSGWGNKLTKRSRRGLEYRVFRVYLPFVERPHSYSRPP